MTFINIEGDFGHQNTHAMLVLVQIISNGRFVYKASGLNSPEIVGEIVEFH